MRAWRQWLLTVVATTGLAACLIMAQVVLSHYDWRLDLTPEQRFTLSPHARRVLETLQHDVQITAFIRAGDPRNVEIDDLVRRARAASPHVQGGLIDLNRNPGVARRYGVGSYTGMVVESEGRRRDFANPSEDLLIAAVLQVTREVRKVVYFVAGHGERSPESNDRRTGYSLARAALTDEFYDVRRLDLIGASNVPADASVVVFAGPQDDPLPSELAALQAYVDGGGALLLMLEPHGAASLGAFLARYGVKVGDDVVVDPDSRLFAGDYLTLAVSGLSELHPVSAALHSPPLFSQARTVVFGAARPGVRGIEFLHTAPSSWATSDLDVGRTGTATFVAGRDQRGALPVAVSLLAGPADDPRGPVARFIVFGDADFATNFFIDYLGNKDLLVNAVNWLAGEEALVGEHASARIPGVNQFFLTDQQGRTAFLLGTVVQPTVVLLLGLVVHARRRWRG